MEVESLTWEWLSEGVPKKREKNIPYLYHVQDFNMHAMYKKILQGLYNIKKFVLVIHILYDLPPITFWYFLIIDDGSLNCLYSKNNDSVAEGLCYYGPN